MKRILKSEAAKMYNAGERVSFMPSGLCPWVVYPPSTITKKEVKQFGPPSWSFYDFIKDYEERYCNNKVGKKVAFYKYETP